MTKAAVIVETRDIDINKVIEDHFRYLGEDWKLVVFGTKNILDKIEWYDQFFLIPDDAINSLQDYNQFMVSNEFWDHINYDKILVFQADSKLLRQGIEDFMHFDWIGAPWKHITLLGGNGGLSIRSVEKSKEVISRVKYDVNLYGNEDLYFSKFIHKFGGNVAPMCEAMKFSVETIFYPNPVGCHAPEKYLTKEQLEILHNA